MAAKSRPPDPPPADEHVEDAAKSPADPIDFEVVIERLRSRAEVARDTGRKNKYQSTVVAAFAIIALLAVVVGAEDVVRRQLVPDVRDVAAAKLTAANQAARSTAEEAARKNAAALIAKAGVETIDEELAAAKRAVEDAKTAEANRGVAFAVKEKALAEKAQADADVKQQEDSLAATTIRSAGDIEDFRLAGFVLKDTEATITQINAQASEIKDRIKRVYIEIPTIKQNIADAKNPKSGNPENLPALEVLLDNADSLLGALLSAQDEMIQLREDFEETRANAIKAYDDAAAAAEKAQETLNTQGQALRIASTAAAVAEQISERADAAFTDANSKAVAAQTAAAEANSPDAIKQRNERRAEATASATIASEIATAAQEAADIARKTARDLADAAAAPAGNAQKTNIQQAITRGGAVAGAIGIAILLVQIFVNSMRYYARLAEFYDAQADALLASGGNPVIAGDFMEKFSPLSIDFGKSPTSIYEKALDTIGSVAGTAAKRGQG